MDRRRALTAAQSMGGKYMILPYIVFDGTLIFDTGQYANEKTSVSIKFRRTDIASNVYLYGVSVSPRFTAHLAKSGYWRYGDAYPTFDTEDIYETVAEVSPTKITVGRNFRTFEEQSFTTNHTVPIGGHKPSSGVPTPQFIGHIYYFRMSIDGIMVADWIPVRRLSDGLDCFFDRVTNTFIEPIQ